MTARARARARCRTEGPRAPGSLAGPVDGQASCVHEPLAPRPRGLGGPGGARSGPGPAPPLLRRLLPDPDPRPGGPLSRRNAGRLRGQSRPRGGEPVSQRDLDRADGWQRPARSADQRGVRSDGSAVEPRRTASDVRLTSPGGRRGRDRRRVVSRHGRPRGGVPHSRGGGRPPVRPDEPLDRLHPTGAPRRAPTHCLPPHRRGGAQDRRAIRRKDLRLDAIPVRPTGVPPRPAGPLGHAPFPDPRRSAGGRGAQTADSSRRLGERGLLAGRRAGPGLRGRRPRAGRAQLRARGSVDGDAGRRREPAHRRRDGLRVSGLVSRR
jgi:hypothetical protein